MGVEFGLPCVMPIPVDTLFPWIEMPQAAQAAQAHADEDDEWAVPAPAESPTVSLGRALQVSGLQHVIHNASRDMLSVCTHFTSHVDSVAAVAKLLKVPTLQARLFATCFSSDVGMAMRPALKGVRCRVHDKRWNTFAMAAADVVQRERPLCWGWNLTSYQRDEKKPTAHTTQVDEAITSDDFSLSAGAVDLQHELVTEVSSWARGCPCHTDLLTKNTPPQARARWKKCACRTFRFPELCAGGLLAHIRDVMLLQGVGLSLKRSEGVAPEIRDKVIANFYLGQAHLLATVTAKLAPYMEPPLLLGATAHHDEDVVKSALRRCLAATCAHALIQELQTPLLSTQAEDYLTGWATIDDVPELAVFMAQFKWVLVDETIVEGLHAVLERVMAHVVHRTAAGDSIGLRMPFFRVVLSKFPDAKDQVAEFLSVAHSPGLLAKHLGMHMHPSAPLRRNAWAVEWRDLIYRCDEGTRELGRDIPRVEVRALGDCDGPKPLDPIPRNTGSIYARLLWLAAVDAVIDRARALASEFSSDSRPLFLSCNISSGGIASISSMFRESGGGDERDLQWLYDSETGVGALSEAAAGPWIAQQVRGGQLILSMVNPNISKLHRVRKGSLCRSDLNVNVHRILKVNQHERRLMVGASPVNIDAIIAGDAYAAGASLVLSLATLDLESLLGLRYFTVAPGTSLAARLDLTGVGDVPECATESVVDKVAEHVAWGNDIPDDVRESAQTVLLWLRSKDLLDGKALREASKHRLHTGWWLAHEGNVLETDPQAPMSERSRYHLMRDMEANDWRFSFTGKRKKAAASYDPTAEAPQKTWWALVPRNEDKLGLTVVVRPYLMALLQGGEHGKLVPHCAPSQEMYWRILDQEWEPKKRIVRRKCGQARVHVDDEWADPDIPDAPKPKRRKAAAAAAEPWMSEQSGEEEPEDDSSDSSSSSSASTSASSNSSDSGSDDSAG